MFLEGRQASRLFKTSDHLLDAIDLSSDEIKILDMLRKNSRENVLSMAKKTKLDPRVVSSRIKKLQKNGVISGFKTKLNMAELGYQPCVALISLGKCSEEELRRFVTHCRYAKGISYLVRQMGKYEIDLKVNVKSTNEFYALVDNLRERFSFVKKITTLIAKEGS
jgi:Lrp/AsnC family transcriptional regulator of ectoine degradation